MGATGQPRVLPVKEVLERPLVRGVARVHQPLQPLLKAVAEETVVDARNAHDLEIADSVRREVALEKARVDEIHTIRLE